MSKLTPSYLDNLHNRISRVQEMATTYGTYQSNKELLEVVDHLSRVAGFLAMEMSEYISKEGTGAMAPHEYLDNKLSVAEEIMKKYYERTRER